MKRRCIQLLAVSMLLLLAACNSATSGVSSQTTATPIKGTLQATPSPTRVVPVAQQPLPKGLLKPKYPVLDWVFSRTCSLAVNSYSSSQANTTIAYDSAAWLYPSDGHLVEGWQDCDKNALLSQVRNQGEPTLLTVGVDGSWSAHDLAQYIDQAASQPQVSCTALAATYICNIVNWALSGGYAGVIIDFEIVAWNYPGIRLKFATFMQELQSALHKKGLLCGVTLISKVGDTPGEDPLYKINNFQDWKLLSRVDFLVDMVLDLDLVANKPGPITAVPWIEKQLDYLWQTAPQALSKAIFELPLYGREWQQDAHGKWKTVSDETCQQISVQKAAQALLPAASTDPTTSVIAWHDQNGNRHEVWYSNASSLLALMTQVQGKVRSLLNNPHYKLPTSFWYRGAECANFFGVGNALAAFYNKS
jgi:hypothetical protein